MGNELAAALARFAESDLRYVRKYRGHMIARTKQGNVWVEYYPEPRTYGVMGSGSMDATGGYVPGEVFLNEGTKAEALAVLVSLYDVVSK